MSKGNVYLLVALSLVSATTFAAKERAIRVQNTVRVGYDDNVYQDNQNDGSGFITDIINISGKMTFSSRSDMLIYWQPEFRYRMDADPKMVTYQDLYARFNHAISQRTFLKISDRFRYQQKDGQTGGAVERANQNFFENDLLGALDFTLNPKSQVNVGAGYEFRVWDDENYGKGLGNDYDQFKANGSYIRELKPNTTQGLLGINYVDHAYDGDRGGFNSTTVFAGVDQNFNANVIGNARLGYSFSNVDGGSTGADNDTSSPYLQAGMEVNPTARTSFTGSLGYSLYQSDNSVYNAQDRFNLALGVRHDLTGKVSLSSSITYIYSLYDADYKTGGYPSVEDAQDGFFVFNLRGSYQINRNNFVDAGYQFSNRDSDSAFLNQYDRNVVDIGWRLRL